MAANEHVSQGHEEKTPKADIPEEKLEEYQELKNSDDLSDDEFLTALHASLTTGSGYYKDVFKTVRCKHPKSTIVVISTIEK